MVVTMRSSTADAGPPGGILHQQLQRCRRRCGVAKIASADRNVKIDLQIDLH
jgi:hypothetical protein